MILNLFFLLSLAISSLATNVNVNSIVYHLGHFQGEGGGFQHDGIENLRDTADALFLATLFGSQRKIDTTKAIQFVEKLHNPDQGYGNQVGAPSDLESVHNALLSFASVGGSAQDSEAVAQFVHSLFDTTSNLFAPTKGASGDLKATATAFQCFELLGLKDSKEVTEKAALVKKALTPLVKSEAGKKFFYSLTSDNYYGILVAKQVGFTFDNLAAWARYFFERRAQNGGYFADADLSEVTVVDTANAVLALHALDKSFASDANINTFVNNLAGNIRTAALAYRALARTGSFQDIWKIEPIFLTKKHVSYANPEIFVQGAAFRPHLIVRSLFGLPHAGLTVTVDATHTAVQKEFTLTWDPEHEVYQSFEAFETDNLFGDLTFEFSLSWNVPELGDVELEHTVTKPVSYWTDVQAKAVSSGKSVQPEGVVGFGTQFSFDLSLGNIQNTPTSPLKQGDFDIFFAVLDSSNTLLHEESLDGRNNKDTFHFDYVLSSTNVPAGQLTFRFTVKTDGVVHTTHVVPYLLSVPMVATEIKFAEKKASYQIGDSLQVSMVPASLPDLRTVQKYGSAKRSFVLDVSDDTGSVVLFSIRGVCEYNKQYICHFKLPIEAHFDALGTKHLSFHYAPAVGSPIPLQNYDSENGELFADGTHISYVVESDLEIVNDVQKPRPGQLEYGNNIKFSFQVQDKITGQSVWDSSSGRPSVFLALKHEKGKPTEFVSTFHPVTQTQKDGQPQAFDVDWTVNPNAVKGASSLELVVKSPSGKETPLHTEGKAWALEVEIGGRIDVEQSTYSLVQELDTVFLLDFELSCQKTKLQNAALFAKVTLNGKELLSSPVILGQAGHYQVSWVLPNKKAVSGDYNIKVFREVDQRRLGQAAEPFFSTSLTHSPPMTSPLPVKTEVLVAGLIGAVFLVASLKKIDIEKIPTFNKKK